MCHSWVFSRKAIRTSLRSNSHLGWQNRQKQVQPFFSCLWSYRDDTVSIQKQQSICEQKSWLIIALKNAKLKTERKIFCCCTKQWWLTRNFDGLALNVDGSEEDAGEPGEAVHVEDGQRSVERVVNQTADPPLLQPIACAWTPETDGYLTFYAQSTANRHVRVKQNQR